jgi:hypothetical protein
VTRYAKCGSETCKKSAIKCSVAYKIEYCKDFNVAKYFWQGTHSVPDLEYQLRTTSSPSKFVLSTSERNFIDALVHTGIPLNDYITMLLTRIKY